MSLGNPLENRRDVTVTTDGRETPNYNYPIEKPTPGHVDSCASRDCRFSGSYFWKPPRTQEFRAPLQRIRALRLSALKLRVG